MNDTVGLLGLFGSLGTTEIIVIGLVALLIFGGRLPDVARSLGKSFVEFKRGLKDVKDEVNTAVQDAKQAEPDSSKPLPPK